MDLYKNSQNPFNIIEEIKNKKNNIKKEIYYNIYCRCNKFFLVLEVIKINFIHKIITINCEKHGIKNKLIDEYLNIVENIKLICLICWKELPYINLKLCSKCEIVMCEKCAFNHKNKNNISHLILNLKDFNNKCKIHNSKNNIILCNNCNMNYCSKCFNKNIHFNHNIIEYINIIPNKKNIEFIKNFFITNLHNIFDDIIYVDKLKKFNKLLFNSYLFNRNNYQAIININNYIE